MPNRKAILLFVTTGVIFVVASAVWLITATPAKAQCGSQASSCKNCHEVQGQKSVNSDGTAWHQSHAFGDFCYICHAGNQQATDKTASHQAMVDPLSDVKASCQQCHATDYQDRAKVYAAKLGVSLGSGGTGAGTPNTSAATPAPTSAQPASTAVAPATSGINYDDPNIVDYTARYNEIVLGQKPVNWGNVALIAMILLIAVGGGGFVIANEKLVNVSFGDTKKAGEDYPADVVDMLPALTKLKASTRQSLKRLIENPRKTEKVLGLIDEIVSDKKEEE